MKGIIFDVDGTLLDSMPIWRNASGIFIQSMGITPVGDDDREMVTMSMMDGCRYLINKYGLNMPPDKLLEGIINAVADKYRNDIPPKTGVLDYLAYERARGTKMCVVTASHRSYVTEALVRLNMYDYFEFMLTCDEEELDKNTPEIYHRACKRLGCTPDETLVFEDAANAVLAAKRGGYRVYGVYDESAAAYRREIEDVCDRYIMDFRELKNL